MRRLLHRLAGPLPPGSLLRRLLIACLVAIVLALAVAGVAIDFILHRFIRGQIDGRLDAQVTALVSALERDGSGRLALRGSVDGPAFERPGSGWYWQIVRGGERLRSASLEGGDLALPDQRQPRDGAGRPLPADGTGPRRDPIILRVLSLDAPGQEPTIVAASAPLRALNGPLREATATLAVTLALLGSVLVGAVIVGIRQGLRPLGHLRRLLAEVRAGTRERLPERQPEEIRPLVAEVNALLDANAAGLAQARAHVANLAHALKTPLATLALRLGEPGRDPGGELAEIAGSMDRRVRHHLRRARAAAVAGPVRARVPLAPAVADFATTFARIYAAKAPELTFDAAEHAVAVDPQDLDEMLGNLIDNACQWCAARVRVTAASEGASILIRVEDDGPGLSAAQRAALPQPGRRLDETVPGTGFGLSITRELAELYGGGLTLAPSSLGGLEARLHLPR